MAASRRAQFDMILRAAYLARTERGAGGAATVSDVMKQVGLEYSSAVELIDALRRQGKLEDFTGAGEGASFTISGRGIESIEKSAAITIPSGTVTLVFSDIEGSSALWETHREGFRTVLDEHNRLMRGYAQTWHGREVKNEGDSFFFAFAKASDAIRFALNVQRALDEKNWNSILPVLESLRVRIGIHTGEPQVIETENGIDFLGPAVNRANRIMAKARSGQVIVSGTTYELARRELPDVSFLDLGICALRGIGNESMWQACKLNAENEPTSTE